ncbi:GNAT family N-acetyltransferase [Marimonas lutisalis]|uniref:GNAT family N-acetyltransferase n=1 Tax=Marimonas lutisalis TaxID=2545756 RepID=UPI0010FA43C7|nr:GNAT family N-acetyltransferase [Marimonas lutisalis]
MIHIRRATPADARAMAELLNAIIAQGGTTALTDPITGADLSDKMAGHGVHGVWHLAEDDDGTLLGFQWIGPYPDLPPEACDIATFVRVGETGLGIGSRLFAATAAAARDLGYEWINANIRADNSGGLAYYQSRGFETWGRREGVALADGTIVDKILKRYDL